MFCLRHYGEDASGKRTKIEYFSTRAASASSGQASAEERRSAGADFVPTSLRTNGSVAEASTTTVRTVISGGGEAPSLNETSAAIAGFGGVELDAEAQEEIARVLAECAARRRAVAGTADDESEPFVAAEQPLRLPKPGTPEYEDLTLPARSAPAYHVVAAPEEMVEPSAQLLVQPDEQYRSGEGEMPWEMLDDEAGMAAVEEAVTGVREAKGRAGG